MLKKGFAKMVFAALTMAFVCLLALGVNAYEDAENVAFVDGTYEVTGEETGTQGESADYPFTSLAEAYKSLYNTGGTVVVCGKTMTDKGFPSGTAVKHTKRIYFTSTFEGVDYAAENDARIVMYTAFHFGGDVTLENITISTKNNCFIHANGFKLVFGEGINVLKGTAADQNLTDSTTGEYIDSSQNIVVRSGGESVYYDRDLYLEFNSGLFSAIHAGTKAYNVDGNVNVVINTPNITSVNLGNDVAKDSLGNTIYTEYSGDVNVSVNADTGVSFKLNYIKRVGGSINIVLNNGAECGLNFTLVPDKGLHIVKANGNGRVENLGGGRFRAVADEGYVAMVPADVLEPTTTDFFSEEFEFTATLRDTDVVFVDRANKIAPTGVYAYPASGDTSADGEIRGVNPCMEYRPAGSDSYIAIQGSTITGLTTGDYEVRFKAEAGYAAGEALVVTVSGRSADVVINEALSAREAKIEAVRSSTSSLNHSDYTNVYYVSTSGTDRDDLKIGSWVIREYGKTEATAYKTVAFATSKAVAGDLIVLKRGDTWRERIALKSGVDYSSYGDANLPMPFLYGSPENGADASKWSLVEGTDNIWLYAKELSDVGVIVFNEGEENSLKEIPDYYDGTYYVRGTKGTEVFDYLTHLDRDLEHFNLYTAGQSTVYIPKLTSSKLYLRCDRGNPGEVFDSIEFNTTGHVVTNAAGCHFDNIGIKYGGSHGIGGGASSDFTVTNCEIGWIGGVVQLYKQSTAGEFGTATRFGNGIEIWQNCDGFRVEDCYVYQCYDAGLTHQGRASNTETGVPNNSYMRDVYFCNNLLEYNVYNIEYFLSHLASSDAYAGAGYDYPMMTNINYTGNLCFYAGYGFGKQRPDAGRMCHINGWTTGNPADGFNVSGNTFFDSVDYIVYMGAEKKEYLPVFDDNIYIQQRGTCGACFGESKSMSSIPFDDGIQQYYVSAMGDSNYEVIFLEVLQDGIVGITDERNGKLYITGLDGYTAVSFNSADTWETPNMSVAEYSLDVLGDDGIMVKALSRGNDSKESGIVSIQIIPLFETENEDKTVITGYNSASNDERVFFPVSAKSLSEDFAFAYVPKYAYISHTATELRASLEEMKIKVIPYGDVNTDGSISFADLSELLCHLAAGNALADEFAADVDFNSVIGLKDLSALFKLLK